MGHCQFEFDIMVANEVQRVRSSQGCHKIFLGSKKLLDIVIIIILLLFYCFTYLYVLMASLLVLLLDFIHNLSPIVQYTSEYGIKQTVQWVKDYV